MLYLNHRETNCKPQKEKGKNMRTGRPRMAFEQEMEITGEHETIRELLDNCPIKKWWFSEQLGFKAYNSFSQFLANKNPIHKDKLKQLRILMRNTGFWEDEKIDIAIKMAITYVDREIAYQVRKAKKGYNRTKIRLDNGIMERLEAIEKRLGILNPY